MQAGVCINYVNLDIDSSLLWVYHLNVYNLREELVVMPRLAVEDNSRMSLRIRAEEKTLLLRAVALSRTNLTDFVLRHALSAAKAVIEEADHVRLSARDSMRVLDLLENPPAPNAKLAAAARALPKP
jgi:uncharacterized protein (DUF1778 family)